MNINTVSMEQHGDDYSRPNADLEAGPQIRSKGTTKKYVFRMFEGIGEFKDYEYHIELDAKFKPRLQTPHKVALSVESRLKGRVRLDGKTRHGQ